MSEIDANNEEHFIATTRNTGGVPDAGLPSLIVAVQITAHPPINVPAPLAEACKSGGRAEGSATSLVAGSLAMQGCHWIEEENSSTGPLESTLLTTQLDNGQFLNIEANWRTESPGAKEIALEIAKSLLVKS
jgi:hypothetical protein